jgi:hypothetical protein
MPNMINIIPNFISTDDIDDMISNTNFQEFTPVDYSPGVMTSVPYKPSRQTVFTEMAKLNYGNLQSVEMLLYKVNSHSPLHMDRSSFDGGKKWIRTAILMCNDAYEGGELMFPNLSMNVKLPKGTLISFPAGNDSVLYTHGVNKIISGDRISLVFRFTCG